MQNPTVAWAPVESYETARFCESELVRAQGKMWLRSVPCMLMLEPFDCARALWPVTVAGFWLKVTKLLLLRLLRDLGLCPYGGHGKLGSLQEGNNVS